MSLQKTRLLRQTLTSWLFHDCLARTTVVRAGFAVLMIWTAYGTLGQSGAGTLTVEIRDKANGRIVPAMVSITSLPDGSWRTPPDGRVTPPYTTVRDFYTPSDWKPGDIGPVRVTNGEYKDNNTRSFVYEGESAYPFWRETAAYFVSKPFSITLPEGKWRLAVARGIENLPFVEEFEIRPNQTRKRKIALERWVDMTEHGWYSGDDHVHYPRTKPEHNEFLLTWAQAEDLHVTNILRMGDIKTTYFEQAGYGKEFRYQQGDYVLVSGQEDPRTGIAEQGHTIALNISAPVRDTTRYHLYDFMFDGVHAQGGLVGYAHIAWAPEYYRRGKPELNPTWDTTINVARGKVDFFEILQFRRLGLEDYYDFLNLGFKLTASAGSDLPWGNTIGEVRVYAYTGGQFSADAWFDAMKQGRTFVTNGPMLTLTAGDAIPGDELKVSRNATVRVRARAWAPPVIGSPKSLELIASGRVAHSVESSNPTKRELQIDFSLRAEESQWIAARVVSHNGAVAHTSPVYILVNGEDFRNNKELPQLVEKRLKVLGFIEGRLSDPKFTAGYAENEIRALTDRVEQARMRYRQLLSPASP
jgi:hypothetical protein